MLKHFLVAFLYFCFCTSECITWHTLEHLTHRWSGIGLSRDQVVLQTTVALWACHVEQSDVEWNKFGNQNSSVVGYTKTLLIVSGPLKKTAANLDCPTPSIFPSGRPWETAGSWGNKFQFPVGAVIKCLEMIKFLVLRDTESSIASAWVTYRFFFKERDISFVCQKLDLTCHLVHYTALHQLKC